MKHGMYRALRGFRRSLRRYTGSIGNKADSREKGVTLIETIIAIALLGIIGSVLMGGMTGIYRAVPAADEQEIAKELARSQIETVMKKPYALSYSPAPIPAMFPGYTAAIDVTPYRLGNIEKIVVTIRHNGEPSTTLEIIKANR